MLAQELPIYKQTFDFICAYDKVFVKMPKSHKFTLGSQIYSLALPLFEYIENYNRAYDNLNLRREYLGEYLVKLNTIETLLRIGVQVCAISFKQQATLNKFTVQLGKQAVVLKNKIAGGNV